MKLRSYLTLLALGAIVPLAIFGIVAAYVLDAHHQATFRQGVEARTHAVLTALDSEIEGSIATALALGASLNINAADFGAFREVAERILATQPNWSNINLALPSGQQVVNLQRPPGAPLHSIAGVDDSLQRILRTREPVVNDVAFGPVTQKWDVAIRVPIVRDDAVRYILSVILKPESLTELLRAQNLPADWIGVLIDRQGTIVARSRDAEASVGKPASQPLRDAAARAPAAWRQGETIEGLSVHTAHRRSTLTGWTFAIGVPSEAVSAAVWKASWLMGLGLLSALALAALLSYLIARRIRRPIEVLASATEAIGRGVAAEVPEVESASEVRSLSRSLQTAVQAMRKQQQTAEREKELLRSADAAKDEFIAMLSHELRNPLAALTAASHLLNVERLSAQTLSQARGVIERQTRHMTRMIEDLLDISRVTMGKAGLEPETFELGAAVEGWVGMWRTGGRLAGHEVMLQVRPVWIHADRSRVEQILSNLLDNALKFTPRGGRVRISVGSEGADAVLRVADSGEGLAPELLERVFAPFVQVGQDSARARGGLGIGLALVKRLAEAQGGRVQASSAGPGRGSTFTVRFSAALAKRGVQTPDHPAASDKRCRILIVEDNEDARLMLRSALAVRGHEVRDVADAETALECVHAVSPDAVVIDIGLPGMDGYQLARQLREQIRKPMTLVAVTGYGQSEDRRKAFAAGFDKHLTKPVSPTVVEDALGLCAEP